MPDWVRAKMTERLSTQIRSCVQMESFSWKHSISSHARRTSSTEVGPDQLGLRVGSISRHLLRILFLFSLQLLQLENLVVKNWTDAQVPQMNTHTLFVPLNQLHSFHSSLSFPSLLLLKHLKTAWKLICSVVVNDDWDQSTAKVPEKSSRCSWTQVNSKL